MGNLESKSSHHHGANSSNTENKNTQQTKRQEEGKKVESRARRSGETNMQKTTNKQSRQATASLPCHIGRSATSLCKNQREKRTSLDLQINN
jgi:intergrase/recombinase